MATITFPRSAPVFYQLKWGVSILKLNSLLNVCFKSIDSRIIRDLTTLQIQFRTKIYVC